MNGASRAPVALLPLFRSATQYRLLGELYTNPAAEWTVGELAERTGGSHPTVSREVRRLEEAGLLLTRREGNRTLVSADPHTPVFLDLRSLLAKVYGPPAVIREEFLSLSARVVVFGSWAARWYGVAGPSPNDVDVLVIGDVDPTEAWDAAARASRRLGIEVNVVVRTPDEWEADDSGFASDVRRGSVLELLGPDGSSTHPMERHRD